MVDDTGEGNELVYAVRLSERARRDIEAAAVRLAELENDFIAKQWEGGLFERAASLAHDPARYPLIPEDVFRRPTHQIVYRRTTRSVAYRILYSVYDDSPDGPQVQVIHVRHSAAAALTVDRAREIEAQANF